MRRPPDPAALLLCLISLLLPLIAAEFVSPPPNGTEKDLSKIPNYTQGSVVNIQWTTLSKQFTARPQLFILALYQLDLKTGGDIGNPEPIGDKLTTDAFKLDWTVFTNKDLVQSNVFQLRINTDPDSIDQPIALTAWDSQVFNLTAVGSITSVRTSTTSFPNPTVSKAAPTATGSDTTPTNSTAVTSPAVTSGPPSTDASSPTGTPSPSPSSGPLSTAALIGLGMAIPFIILFGILAVVGWFLMHRKRRKQLSQTASKPPEDNASTSSDETIVYREHGSDVIKRWNPPTATSPGYWSFYTAKTFELGAERPPPTELCAVDASRPAEMEDRRSGTVKWRVEVDDPTQWTVRAELDDRRRLTIRERVELEDPGMAVEGGKGQADGDDPRTLGERVETVTPQRETVDGAAVMKLNKRRRVTMRGELYVEEATPAKGPSRWARFWAKRRGPGEYVFNV